MATLVHLQTKTRMRSPASQILQVYLPSSKGCPLYPYLPTTSPITSCQNPTCLSTSSSSYPCFARFSDISFPVHPLHCFCISVVFGRIILVSTCLLTILSATRRLLPYMVSLFPTMPCLLYIIVKYCGIQ